MDPERAVVGTQEKSPQQETVVVEDSDNEKPQRKSAAFWFALVSLMLGVFVVSLDATSLPVAIPTIAHDLQGTTLEAFWANLSFLLTVVVVQPIYTNFSDVLGRKIPLYTSFVFFVIGSIVFALAQNMDTLIVGRILQGLGGGGLDVLAEVILADMTTLKERSLYLGLLSLPLAGGGACGGLLGAAFTEYASWRWLGWINLPFLGAGLVLSIFFLRLRRIDQSWGEKIRRIDAIGMLLLVVGCTAFSVPLSWAGLMYPWSSWKTLFPFIVGIFLLVALAFYESRPIQPMLPYRIFQNQTAIVTLIGSFAHGALMYSLMFYAPLFYQAVRLESTFKSAVSVLPVSCSIVGFSIISAVAVEMARRYRWGVILGWLFATVGTGLWALWETTSSNALTYSLQVIAGMGVGTLLTIQVIPMQASVSRVDDSGLAAGILVSFRLFGGLVGLAVCATVFSNVFEREIVAIHPLPPQLVALNDASTVIGFIPSLRTVELDPEIKAHVLNAYRISIQAVYLALAGIGALGFVTSLWTKDLTLEKEEHGHQKFEQ